MLQPTVCMRALCAHQFHTFGARIVGAMSLATHAEVLPRAPNPEPRTPNP